MSPNVTECHTISPLRHMGSTPTTCRHILVTLEGAGGGGVGVSCFNRLFNVNTLSCHTEKLPILVDFRAPSELDVYHAAKRAC